MGTVPRTSSEPALEVEVLQLVAALLVLVQVQGLGLLVQGLVLVQL